MKKISACGFLLTLAIASSLAVFNLNIFDHNNKNLSMYQLITSSDRVQSAAENNTRKHQLICVDKQDNCKS